MNMWNYVVSVHKPTAVTHCCVGNFTGPRDINLIIAKSTWIEIHSLSSQGLQKVLQVPIYGRIAVLELFRPAGEQQDSLVISTEEYKLSVVQWNNNGGSELITRAVADVWDFVANVWDFVAIPVKSGYEIGMGDPDCQVIGLHLFNGVFTILAYDGVAGVTHAFDIMLDRTVEVVDIKFLYGCSKPTIAVLYQQQLSCMNGDELQVRTYEVDVKGRDFKEMPWSVPNLDHGARMLIPVPMPFGGVIIIGEKTIAYFSPSPSVVFKAVPTPNSMTIIQAYAKVHDSQYLLGDHMGHLHLLSLIHEKGTVTGLNIDLLGDTSVASTICYLENGFVYIGSDEGDSQLVKLHLPPDSIYGSVGFSVVETYVNLGPIVDFCVVDHGGQEHVVTCSGGFNHGCLRILRSGIRINEHAAAEFADVTGMWPLRASSTRDDFDTYLVLSFLGETRVLAINSNDELEETHEIQGFVLHAPSLFCQDAIHDQLVQVTASSVRLMSASSGQLLSEWRAPTATGLSITVATGSATQVLLATRGCNIVYLEIGEGSLTLKGHKKIEYDVSCMDITPIGQDSKRSELAAVGLWKDQSIRIYSLPDLKLIQSLQFAENVVTRSVLFCKFEGISYLLCGLGDGHLYNLTLNVSSGELSDGEKKKISLGTKGINLRTFRHENATHVLALGDRATVICSSNLRLAYSNVSVGEVNHMCSFHSKSFPNSIVVVREDMLSFGSIDNIQNIYISSVHLEEHPYRICYQDKSGTFAICSMKYGYDEMQKHFIRLLDEKTFENISSYPLDMYEEGCSILSCSFTDDHNTVYCCVGTAYRYPDQETIFKKGRILVFSVGNRQLRLVTEKETKGAVYNLNAFNGKLVAGINEKIDLYKWMIRDDVSRELEFECGHPGHVLALCVKTRGDFILVGDCVQSMYLLVYKNIDERGGILEEKAHDYSANYMTVVEFLDDDTYVGTDQKDFDIFVVKKKNDAAIDSEEERKLKLEGEYHLGALVNQFRRASLAQPLPLYGNTIPTVIFGTTNGMIGLIASLPEEQYQILQKLQMHFVNVIRGVGGLNHEQWRSFNTGDTRNVKQLLDGDLIESFLDLNSQRMSEIATAMTIPIDELCKMVEYLASLH